jgi:hypothetical protein
VIASAPLEARRVVSARDRDNRGSRFVPLDRMIEGWRGKVLGFGKCGCWLGGGTNWAWLPREEVGLPVLGERFFWIFATT